MLYIFYVFWEWVSTITTGMEEVPWLSDSFKVSQQMEMRLEAVVERLRGEFGRGAASLCVPPTLIHITPPCAELGGSKV